jgi:hypothetical protein
MLNAYGAGEVIEAAASFSGASFDGISWEYDGI